MQIKCIRFLEWVRNNNNNRKDFAVGPVLQLNILFDLERTTAKFSAS